MTPNFTSGTRAAAAFTRRAADTDTATGFSHSTCTPASNAASVIGTWS
jgi:hypothetical protein